MLVSFGMMVLSSIIASWSDIIGIFTATYGAADSVVVAEAKGPVYTMMGLNIGYFWMLANCFASAAYVSPPWIFMHSTVLLIIILGIDNAQTNQANRFQGLGYHVLQQFATYPTFGGVVLLDRRLVLEKPRSQLVRQRLTTNRDY